MDLNVPQCKSVDPSSSFLSSSGQRGGSSKQNFSSANGKTASHCSPGIAINSDNNLCQQTSNNSNNKPSDTEKRKKAKSRSSTIPPNPFYPKDLDAWLENCLKDAAAPQLSSSSEFLDYNPASFNMNKKAPQPSSMTQNSAFLRPFPKTENYPQHTFNINKLLRNSSGMESDANLEFASLPPTVNLGTCLENQDNSDPTRSFRFSDPCLIAPSENDSKMSGQNTPDQRTLESQIGSNKFLAALLEQLSLLRETNTKIYRNLHETKVELEALKHAPNWGFRHRRDSLSGLSTHSQPMGFVFGTQSPAPTYNSGMYTPGMMSDVIREVKEAARVREEALLNRVKAMVEERSWSIGEGNLRLIREIEEVKAHVQNLRSDRKEANKRISQLETENKYMRSILASILNNRSTDIIHENEVFRPTPTRKTTQEFTKSKRNSMSLNYGTINHEDGFGAVSPTDRSTLQKSTSMEQIKLDQTNSDRRSSYTSQESNVTPQNGSFRMVETTGHPNSGREQMLQMEKDALDLRRELQEALASKKQAENRIIALENMVKRLQVRDSGHHHHPNDGFTAVLNGTPATNDHPLLLSNATDKSPTFSPIVSQNQGTPPKLSLAGPITDL